MYTRTKDAKVSTFARAKDVATLTGAIFCVSTIAFLLQNFYPLDWRRADIPVNDLPIAGRELLL